MQLNPKWKMPLEVVLRTGVVLTGATCIALLPLHLAELDADPPTPKLVELRERAAAGQQAASVFLFVACAVGGWFLVQRRLSLPGWIFELGDGQAKFGKFCPHCSYDLFAHREGDKCPECGNVYEEQTSAPRVGTKPVRP